MLSRDADGTLAGGGWWGRWGKTGHCYVNDAVGFCEARDDLDIKYPLEVGPSSTKQRQYLE